MDSGGTVAPFYDLLRSDLAAEHARFTDLKRRLELYRSRILEQSGANAEAAMLAGLSMAGVPPLVGFVAKEAAFDGLGALIAIAARTVQVACVASVTIAVAVLIEVTGRHVGRGVPRVEADPVAQAAGLGGLGVGHRVVGQKSAGLVAVVTGGSRGVGKGIAIALGRSGAVVYVTGRTESGGKAHPLGGTVQETAEAVGFSDAFYFSKVFKRLQGVPPSEIQST